MLRYRDCGVDIEKNLRLVSYLKRFVPSMGGFNAVFPIPDRLRAPVMISSCDGVGTKVKIAASLGMHEMVGLDSVAMIANDILTSGAFPAFFMDYFACGQLDLKVFNSVIRGVRKACRFAGCRLIGGETAQLPGLLSKGEYDIAGFGVGFAERAGLIRPSLMREGDLVIGLSSSGLHANGFSLVRKIFSQREISVNRRYIMRPTRIYVKEIKSILSGLPEPWRCVKGIAHITTGGIPGNLIRVLPKGLRAVIHKESWPRPEIFRQIEKKGGVSEGEMLRVFNMGLGMLIILERSYCIKLNKRLKFHIIGEIKKGKRRVELI